MILIKIARKIMQYYLSKDEDLYRVYKANIAMCIYDYRRKDGRLNHEECNQLAHRLIELLYKIKN